MSSRIILTTRIILTAIKECASDMRFLLYPLLTTIEGQQESLLDESLLDVVELGNVLRAVDQRLDLRLEVIRSLC